ncbi:MAG: hypothetical protein EAZ61_05170, partial [Oscillatoriales cyanobacterium]
MQDCHRSWNPLISDIALRIRQSLELEPILQVTVDAVRGLLDSDRALIYQFDRDYGGKVTFEAISAPQWSLLDRVVRDECFESNWLDRYH